AEAHALSEIGVAHIGILVGKGDFPREQSFVAARQIIGAITAGAKSCALSLSPDLELHRRIVDDLRPDILHFGCAPDLMGPQDVADLKKRYPDQQIMRSIPVVDDSAIGLACSYDGIADFLLLDSYQSGDQQIGALGIPHDWELDRRIVEAVQI